jgi:hypothetical protein
MRPTYATKCAAAAKVLVRHSVDYNEEGITHSIVHTAVPRPREVLKIFRTPETSKLFSGVLRGLRIPRTSHFFHVVGALAATTGSRPAV